MGNLEVLADWAAKRVDAIQKMGHDALKGFGDQPVPPTITPSIFCAGNRYWELAAGSTGEPVKKPDYFEPPNYPPARTIQSTDIRQGEQ